jgi:hypothetical protein
MGKVVLGVDGGGTKTLTVCLDKDRVVVGQFSSACSNHNSVGPESARLAIHAGILGALAAAGRTVDDGLLSLLSSFSSIFLSTYQLSLRSDLFCWPSDMPSMGYL